MPTIGQFVHARGRLGVRNGADVVPAVITRVWGRATIGSHDVWLVNLHVFHDGPETAWRPNVYLFATETEARSFPGWNAWRVPVLP
ncbi:hypothetical protein GCM10010156_52810 [Planobispora rosea]|uniref:Uncharacterized protein n=1 Tax=Planobispora rosea TaxID=35762 RepID=A0A8J3SBB2_PLARO|nr:hypothetical protein [Planobispora rosea]GGS87725.1 hypothetical protein GCM10010156_52810 [Planobispora rosea]GIH86683.1 hypothetical protein Pro02_50910 [Planobispora rosea]